MKTKVSQIHSPRDFFGAKFFNENLARKPLGLTLYQRNLCPSKPGNVVLFNRELAREVHLSTQAFRNKEYIEPPLEPEIKQVFNFQDFEEKSRLITLGLPSFDGITFTSYRADTILRAITIIMRDVLETSQPNLVKDFQVEVDKVFDDLRSEFKTGGVDCRADISVMRNLLRFSYKFGFRFSDLGRFRYFGFDVMWGKRVIGYFGYRKEYTPSEAKELFDLSEKCRQYHSFLPQGYNISTPDSLYLDPELDIEALTMCADQYDNFYSLFSKHLEV